MTARRSRAPALTRLVYGDGYSDPINTGAERELRALTEAARALTAAVKEANRYHGYDDENLPEEPKIRATFLRSRKAVRRLDRLSAPARANARTR